eukprot:gene19136-24975_t
MRQSDCSSKEWTGGGLADIINDESHHKQGVKFIPWNQPINSSQELLDRMKEVNMLFPIICKPIEACGTPISHQLVVIVNSTDYNLIQSPCVVQQYFNHNSILYKVYVMDDDVDIFERSSLPDLTTDINTLKSVAFDSRHHYPTIDQFEATAKLISNEFGLSLFGFDVIIPTNNISTNIYQTIYERNHSIEQKVGFDNSFDQLGPLVVIDVNYFPSYKEVGDFPDRLRAFLRKKAGFSVYVDNSKDDVISR